MFPRQRPRRHFAWIASFAILLGALMPVLSQWVQPAASGTGWVDVCTAQGSRAVDTTGDGGQTAPVDPAHLLEHCPYCALQAHAVGLPPATMAALALVPLRFGLPERFFTAAYTPHAWATPRPRGPPTFS